VLDLHVLRDIHRFWFGELRSLADFPEAKTSIWYQQSDETDHHIREHYGRLIPEAASTPWDVELLSREEAVALIVLLDQFPRNIFRTSSEAFAYDARALELTRALGAPGFERFFWIERVALLLPFEHSEDIGDQDYAVLLAAELAVVAPENLRSFCRYTLDYATLHRDVVRKFGRFPHRNALLGRHSTLEEEAFLAEKGRGF
jgi:uncharacterized protein (DUF924 family)